MKYTTALLGAALKAGPAGSQECGARTHYDFEMRAKVTPALGIDTSQLKPGLRLAVGLSGGADSVALLRALAERAGQLGLVLHAAHLHHGLRGAEADEDLEFARSLAAELGLPFHEHRVKIAAEAEKHGETIEEAARRLRYGWFRQLMASGVVDALATAHTLDDQAETVLAKFLRGAWTEGLSGIHPAIVFPEGLILRPLLATTRVEAEAYLRAIGQSWREDSSNRELTYNRNRIRHELLPLLEGWNPRLREHMAQMATLARDEEAWWEAEMARLGPQILMSGRPVRGGGRAASVGDSSGLSLDVTRFAELATAVQRRLLRFAAGQLGAAMDFFSTESLRALALSGRAGQKLELAQGLRAERSARELRLEMGPVNSKVDLAQAISEYSATIPGEILAPELGLRLRIAVSGVGADSGPNPGLTAYLRNWKPGDRVTLRYSSGPRKVKEVLERLRISGDSRRVWPVLEVSGRIIWMKGVELEPEPGIEVAVDRLDESAGQADLPAPSGGTLGVE